MTIASYGKPFFNAAARLLYQVTNDDIGRFFVQMDTGSTWIASLEGTGSGSWTIYQLGPNEAVTLLQRVLGSKLYEVWDPSVGIALVGGLVDSWTGQVSGKVLQAATAGARATFEAAGWKGKAAVVCDGVAQYLQATALALAVGTRPYMFLAQQLVALPGATVIGAGIVHLGDTVSGTRFTTTQFTARINDATGSETVAASAARDTARHIHEMGLTSAAAVRYVVDGVANAGANSNTAATIFDTAVVGASAGGAAFANVRTGLFVLCSDEPTAGEKAGARLALAAAGY